MKCPYCDRDTLESRMPGLYMSRPLVGYGGMAVNLSKQQYMIVEALAHKWPDVASVENIILWCYQDRDEPESAENTIAVQIVYTRKALWQIGLAIVTSWGHGYALATKEDVNAEEYEEKYKINQNDKTYWRKSNQVIVDFNPDE